MWTGNVCDFAVRYDKKYTIFNIGRLTEASKLNNEHIIVTSLLSLVY